MANITNALLGQQGLVPPLPPLNNQLATPPSSPPLDPIKLQLFEWQEIPELKNTPLADVLFKEEEIFDMDPFHFYYYTTPPLVDPKSQTQWFLLACTDNTLTDYYWCPVKYHTAIQFLCCFLSSGQAVLTMPCDRVWLLEQLATAAAVMISITTTLHTVAEVKVYRPDGELNIHVIY